MPSSKIIVLRSSDGITFEVDEEVAMESQTIKKIIEDVRANTGAFYRFWARLKLLKARRSPTNLLWCCSQQQKSTEKSLDPLFAENNIHLPYVTGRILWKVIEYCTKHVETPKSDDKSAEDDLTSFNADFVKVDIGTLLHLMAAANYLNIESLLDLTCQAAADHMIINKTPEEIRKPFNIKNEFIHDEKDEVL